jgi:hypothetical protein
LVIDYTFLLLHFLDVMTKQKCSLSNLYQSVRLVVLNALAISSEKRNPNLTFTD